MKKQVCACCCRSLMMKMTLTQTSTHQVCSDGDIRHVWNEWKKLKRKKKTLRKKYLGKVFFHVFIHSLLYVSLFSPVRLWILLCQIITHFSDLFSQCSQKTSWPLSLIRWWYWWHTLNIVTWFSPASSLFILYPILDGPFLKPRGKEIYFENLLFG